MQRKNLIILFIVILIDQGSLLIVAPVLPQLLVELTGQSWAQNSLWAGWLTVSYALMQFIAAPFIGQLSDRYGRKLVLLACMLALAADYLVLILATNVWVLFIGRLLAGIPGASIVTAMAAAADISDAKTRVQNFSLLYGAIGLGVILGPLVAGLLVGYGLRVPFYFAMFSCLAAAVGLWFHLTESVKKQPDGKPQRWRDSVDFSLLKRPGFGYLFLGQFIAFIAFQAPLVLWSFFVGYRFNWDAQAIGYSLSALGLLYTFVQVVVVKFTYPRLKTANSIYLGFIFFIIGFSLMALVNSVTIFILAVVIYSLGSIASSAATNVFAVNVGENEQGRIQGLLSSVNSLAAIAGPPLMSWLFYADLDRLQWLNGGLPFLVATVLLLGGMLFYYLGLQRVVNKD